MLLTETQSARLQSIRDVAPGLRVFKFTRPAGFDFLPGQFAVLGLPREGKPVERAYSIVSAPHEDGLEFFIELVPQGRLTPLIFALRPGDEISLRPFARGRFLLDPGAQNHFMVATVTGVAPFVSMLRAAAHASTRARYFLVQGASRTPELGYQSELEVLANGGWLAYRPTVSRPAECPGWVGAFGRAETHIEAMLSAHALAPANTTTYLCGHPGMVANAKGILARAGYEPSRIRSESW